MFRTLARILGRNTRRIVVPIRLLLRAKYDSAQTTEDNRRHWAMADGLSAATANSRTVRRVLRNRARYEVANNSCAKGIVDTLADEYACEGKDWEVQVRPRAREIELMDELGLSANALPSPALA